ncbi:Kinase, AGC NDR [Reticulomyxa filosa]|uniref:non-specific serine/threonine protein kinase n=1 Tax=Reticulomyxa filosa TaxID=46433 RepID=X6MIW7_RETFI|nr:Kinase, AGC NDR [Reticulomyxa filosa]|eukprot:ETO13010.1 Kinase, AGC NDR [Reticulomyxa filosa]
MFICTIKRYREYLRIPKHCNLSKEAKDCIFRLICSRDKRMSFNQLKKHAFFRNVPWHNLRAMRPPFKPVIGHDADTRYFDKVKDVDLAIPSPVEEVEDEEDRRRDSGTDDDGDKDKHHLGISKPVARNSHKKKQSSFNNLDPKGVCGTCLEELDKNSSSPPTEGGLLNVKKDKNHFYGFTFERIPLDKKDIFQGDDIDETE